MRITIGMGVEFDRNNRRMERAGVASALRSIEGIACNLFGGCTIYQTRGSWKNSQGIVVAEQGITLLAYCPDSDVNAEAARQLAEFAKGELRQESVVLVVERGVSAEFI